MSNKQQVESQMVVILEVLNRYKEGDLNSHEVANFLASNINTIKRYPNQFHDSEAMKDVLSGLYAERVGEGVMQ